MLRRLGLVAIAGLSLALLPVEGPAAAAPAPTPCTSPGLGFNLGCATTGLLGGVVRQACDYVWVDALCQASRFQSPGYAMATDPNPTQPLRLLVGAMHEHSGYSDGDPNTIPRDYFRAARDGHNLADAGGDTGVKLDFIFSSEHSDNGLIPITTAMVCLDPARSLECLHLLDTDHYWKWMAALRQSIEESQISTTGAYTGFTGIRGFEWTNDYFNHMNVYFSTNQVNAKIDGSYLSMNFLWNWLREPVAQGGGADALLTFNHPGNNPALTPFDGDTALNELLALFPGGANWNDLAYVPDVDERVAGIEVNAADDLSWYVKALTNGWHVGPVVAEDEHEREWASSAEGKTLVLTRGRSPQDYYFAFQRHRTVAIQDALVGGAPGTAATVPVIHYYADGTGIQDPVATLLGGTNAAGGQHTLHLQASGLPAASVVALVSDTGAPTIVGTADGSGAVSVSVSVTAPAAGSDWYFAVVCDAAGAATCGTDAGHLAVTAPIWFTPAA